MPAPVPAEAKVKKAPEKLALRLVRDSEDEYGGTMTGPVAAFLVEVFSDRTGRAKQLALWDWMAENEGMLFVLPDPGPLWLRVLRMPIDMLCFDRQQRLIALIPGLPSCFLCQLVPVSADCAYMLEINSGLIKKLGIRTGDRFEVDGVGINKQ